METWITCVGGLGELGIVGYCSQRPRGGLAALIGGRPRRVEREDPGLPEQCADQIRDK